MEKLLDKKQIQAIFLFEFQMGHKAAETAHNINNAVSPGPANERMVQRSFKNFCKRDKSLEDEEQSGRPLEIDNDEVRGSLKLILQLCAEEFNIDHSIVVQHLNQIRNVKKHNKWVPHERSEKKKQTKNCRFEVSSSLILPNNNKPFLYWIVTCDKKWILYNNQCSPAQ